MLIYNYKKEFIGIDEKYLQTLGLKNLAELRAEATDFADLFIKTPGYVHNFQHVHWIDYIVCADSTEQPKVLINANGKLFKADVHITTAYLADNPTEKAFLVNLNHLRALTDAEKTSISTELMDRPAPQTTTAPEPVEFNIPSEAPKAAAPAAAAETVIEDEYDLGDLSVDDVVDDALHLHPELTQTQEAPKEEPIIEKVEEVIDEEPLELPDSIELEEPAPLEVEKTDIVMDEDIDKVIHGSYTYNPQIASDELGLPLDLIEEFIEDFINQAKEFKQDLYTALDEGDIDNVKILSHKLKGVAANLRIEDALEVLTTINTTSDLNVIKHNLDVFYVIIAKLAGEEINFNAPDALDTNNAEDELVLDFKDDEDVITIADADVPEEIELPELADDNFVAQEDVKIEFADDIPEEKAEINLEEPLDIEESSEEPLQMTNFSKTALAEDLGLDAESVHDLLEDFQSEATEIISTMKTSLQNSDLDLIHKQARQLKSMSENLKYIELTNTLDDLVQSASIDDTPALLERVQQLLEQISIED